MMDRSLFRHDADDDDDDDPWHQSAWGLSDEDHGPKTTGLASSTPTQPLETPMVNPLESEMSSRTGAPAWPPKGHPTDKSWGPSGPWPPKTLVTSVSSSNVPAHPEQGYPTGSPTIIFSSGKINPSQTGSMSSPGSGPSFDWEQKSQTKHGVLKVAGIAVPMVMVAIIGVLVFFYIRKRKRDKKLKAAELAASQEMKSRSQPFVAAHYNNAPPPPPPPMQPRSQAQGSPVPPHYTPSPSHPAPASPPPVIIGPIMSDSSGAYLTGIDTSDGMSMNDRTGLADRTGLGDPFADSNSLSEEPPPPYRPRSLAALSRDSSLRAPPTAAHSQTNLLRSEPQDTRSPFSDPQDDDDTVSDLSGPTLRRNVDADGMSAVSDMSYQNDPVIVRPTV